MYVLETWALVLVFWSADVTNQIGPMQRLQFPTGQECAIAAEYYRRTNMVWEATCWRERVDLVAPGGGSVMVPPHHGHHGHRPHPRTPHHK